MKILFLITKSNFGGAQRYVFDLATYLNDADYEVVVGYGGDGLLAEKLKKNGIRTVHLPSLGRDVNALQDLRSFIELYQVIHKERPDVLHLNSSKVGALGALAGRIINTFNKSSWLIGRKPHSIRIIFTGHGWALNEDRPDWQRFLIATIHWLTITLSHRTIAVSKRTREEVGKLPFTWHKLSVVHNGTSKNTALSKQLAQDIVLQKKVSTDTEPLIIGTIAELHKNKGLTYALEGLAQLKKQTTQPFRFIVIGEGEERRNLESYRDALGLSDEVDFIGFYPDASNLLPAFDIFLFPSTKEGFPYAILEAGQVGLPIIATLVGGIPEVIDDMESGILIQSKNPGEITRALQYLFEHPDRRTEIGRNAQQRIAGKFNIEKMAQETLTTYGS